MSEERATQISYESPSQDTAADDYPAATVQREFIGPMPKGWIPVSRLNDDTFSGASEKIAHEVDRFLEKKFKLNVGRGLGKEGAERIVRERWGRVCRFNNGSEGVAVSLDTVEAMLESAQLSPKIKGPPPAGWRSLESLQHEYAGSSIGALYKKIPEFVRAQVARRMKEDEYSWGEARNAVRQELVASFIDTDSGSTNPKIYVSPAAVKILEESKTLIRKDSLAPDGWQTAKQLAKKYVGGDEVINNTLKRFVRDKIKENMAGGMPKKEAEENAHARWGNIFPNPYKQNAFYVSTEAVEAMVQSGALVPLEKKLPSPPDENWKTPGMLAESYHGSHKDIEQKIAAFIERKKSRLVAEGSTPEAADKIVHDQWAGEYSAGNGIAALHICKAGVEELVAYGILVSNKDKEVIPEGWQSASMLAEHYEGNASSIRTKINEFLAVKRQQLIDSGLSEPEAERHIKSEWAKKFRNEKGEEERRISPSSINAMEQSGALKLRDKDLLPAPAGWLTISELMGRFFGDHKTLSAKVEKYAADEAAGLAEHMRAEEAKKSVSENIAGWYKDKHTKRKALHVNPDTVADLEGKGILRARPTLVSGGIGGNEQETSHTAQAQRRAKEKSLQRTGPEG